VKIFSLLVLLLATACTFTPTATEERAATNAVTQPATLEKPRPTQTSAPENTLTRQDTATEMPPIVSSGSNEPLWVKILSPEDGATVTTQAVKVIGQAPTETVITINDEIILVQQDQSFEVEILLQEGSNLIDIVASDLSGNEIYIPLTVFYTP